MKSNCLMLFRPNDIIKHLQDETDNKLKIKLVFLNAMLTLNMDLEKVCHIFGMTTSTGYLWIRRWNEGGYKSLSLSDEPIGNPPGRLPKLNEQDLVLLKSNRFTGFP